MKICLVGEGAFGKKHLLSLRKIEDVEVSVLVGGETDSTKLLANEYNIPFWTRDLQEGLAQDFLVNLLLKKEFLLALKTEE